MHTSGDQGSPSLATPTNLGPGTVGNLQPRFLQHTTSVTEISAEASASVVYQPHGGQEPPGLCGVLFPQRDIEKLSSNGCLGDIRVALFQRQLRCVADERSTLPERSCCHASVWNVHLCCAEGKWRCVSCRQCKPGGRRYSLEPLSVKGKLI